MTHSQPEAVPATATFTRITAGGDHTFTAAETQQIPRVEFGDLTSHSGRVVENGTTLVVGADKYGNLALAEVSDSPGAEIVTVDVASRPEARARVCSLYRPPLPGGDVILAQGNQRYALPDTAVDFCVIQQHQPDWPEEGTYDTPAEVPECALDLGELEPFVNEALRAALAAHEWLQDQIAALPPIIVPVLTDETTS